MPVFAKDDRRILFIHIPKTGGSSVTKHFADSGWDVSYLDKSSISDPQSANYLRKISPQHMHAEHLNNIFNLSKFDFIFSIVRHPVSRLKSEFAFRNPNVKQNELSADLVNAWWESELKKYKKNKNHLDNHLRPQVEFLTKASAIFKLENGLSKIFELERSLSTSNVKNANFELKENKKVNSSVYSSEEVPIASKTIRSLKRLYRKDFMTFNYKYEIPSNHFGAGK